MKYQIANWESNFEGAKSKTYNNKTSCSIPCKHGLGYKRLIRSKNGPAMFGAWCALIQVLSRHPKPRLGYLTDNGSIDGVGYNCDDLELLTDIPSNIFDELLTMCSSESVGWVKVCDDVETSVPCEETTVDCEETIVPLNSDSDSDLNSDSDDVNSSFEVVWEMYERKGNKQSALRYWKRLSIKDRLAIKAVIPVYIRSKPDIRFRSDFSGWINPANRRWEDQIIDSQIPKQQSHIEVSTSQNEDDFTL